MPRFCSAAHPDTFALFALTNPHPNPNSSATLAFVAPGRWAAARVAWLLTLTCAFAGPDNTIRPFRLPSGPASETLRQFAEQAQREILFPSEPVADVRTPPVFGDYPPREALDRLLAGTRLRALEAPDTGGFVISTTPSPPIHATDAPVSSKPMKAKSTLAAIAGWFALGAATVLPAQTPNAASATGTVEGRVSNPATGEYLELVRITIEGTAREVFTDASGAYRLTEVPAGPARVRAFRTGMRAQIETVTVAPGSIMQRDFSLATHAADGERIQLDAFVVKTASEMDGAAIAINTQRFAPNAMSVVAGDEFGPVANGNAGEVLKSIPGITLSLGSQGEMYQVSLNGVPPNNVPVTVGGFDLANPTGTQRGAGLHLLSVNNTARIEVAYTPTPETPGSALAGFVNLVPRSAFERARPVYNLSVGAVLRDHARDFGKSPGPQHEPSRKINPELMFSAIVPLNKRLGFTVSASMSDVYTPQDFMQTTWRGASAPTNGGTLPDTTPDRPYLTDYAVRDRTALPYRRAFGATLDLRVTPNDLLSLSFQYGFSGAIQSERTLTFLVNRVAPGNFSPTATRGFAGAGETQLTHTTFDVAQHLFMPSLTYRHTGPVWRLEAGAGVSLSTRENTSLGEGFFNQTVARRTGLTVSFDDIFYLRPRGLTVTDATGTPVNPYSIDTYSLSSANGLTLETFAAQRNLFAHARREFLGRVPFTLKGGLDFRQAIKDIRQDSPAFTFVGTGAETRASRVLDESLSQRPMPFGFPRVDWVSNPEMYALYRSSPALFTTNEAASHNSRVAASKHADEIISAAFLRADLPLFDGRLKLVGGLRAEQTNAKGEGQLVDLTRNYRRDTAGRVVLGPDGRTPLPITTNAVEAARLTRIDRGLRAEKEYLRWFPSLNATFNLRENFIARAGYYESVGRPDLVQYAGSLTLPDTEQDPADNNRLNVNNAAIKAWRAQTFKVGLEYYFEGVGVLAVSAFQREIENFFGNTVLRATPEFLALYGLDPGVYGRYEVQTQHNVAEVAKMSGLDVSYKQALTFLPHWARGVQVFGNGSSLRTTGPAAANFAGFVPRTASWGASLTRPDYNVRLRWTYNGRARRGLVAAGRSLESGTYNWASKRLLVDLNGEFRFYRHYVLFANLTNLRDAPVDLEIHGPNTPDHAQFRQRQQWGAVWTFGVRGTF